MEKPNTPTELASKLKIQRSTISRAILELMEKKLVKCLTPKEKMGRLYQITDLGKKFWNKNKMSRIQELLDGRDHKIDYDKLIEKFPWIVEKDHNCILSPDSDGLLCGLLMSHLLNWKIKGFYDGKVMVLEKGLSAKDCIFLDMEIFRKEIRSFGHHMLMLNRNQIPENWENFENCLQPNNMREYDGLHDFRLKYPLTTIHMLLGIIGHKFDFEISEDAIAPLFFTDGTFNVLFSYPENVLNWLIF